MVYTNTVPQANDQISATQAPILANFQFLQTGIGVEHFFNPGSAGLSMTHTKASMANLVSPEVLPAFTNGMYYVFGGDARFLANDGTKCELTKGLSLADGYQWLGRVLLQWGHQTDTSSSSRAGITYPIPFPNNVFILQATLYTTKNTGSAANDGEIAIVRTGASPGTAGFTYSYSNLDNDFNGFYWLAIGN